MYAKIEGGTRPSGTVRVSGAKNSATRLFAAALLSDSDVELQNFPTQLVDVAHKTNFARLLGASVEVDDQLEQVTVSGSSIESRLLMRDEFDVPIRTTYLLAAAQLLRGSVARIPYPGGCPIGGGTSGQRGYDQHIMVWQALGCEVEEMSDHIQIKASPRMRGGKVNFTISTVGGTENALLCASVASGTTEIFNAYITPEVENLIALLRRMGADIVVHGTSHIVVEGRGGPLSGTYMPVMPDRIEALTWIVYAILSQGEITIEGVPFEAMTVPLIHLEHAGIDLLRNSNSVHVSPSCLTSGKVQPFELACGTHPGVISDMQAFFVLLGLVGAGTSRVFDYRYPDRIAFVDELAKMVKGPHLEAERGRITMHGPAEFIAGRAQSTDLRGSMGSVIAALCAPGTSTIEGVQMALRGYNNLGSKLTNLGAKIEFFDDSTLSPAPLA